MATTSFDMFRVSPTLASKPNNSQSTVLISEIAAKIALQKKTFTGSCEVSEKIDVNGDAGQCEEEVVGGNSSVSNKSVAVTLSNQIRFLRNKSNAACRLISSVLFCIDDLPCYPNKSPCSTTLSNSPGVTCR